MKNQEYVDALFILRDAADNWCDYLEEHDREGEIPPIENAIGLVNKMSDFFQ